MAGRNRNFVNRSNIPSVTRHSRQRRAEFDDGLCAEERDQHLFGSNTHARASCLLLTNTTTISPLATMGESRTELINWINELLGFSYTKVEQCGSGAAYAQIIDSIYLNVPLVKIKFDAKHDYEYINNFKVLQDAFKRNRIDKPIPVDRLIRCKMQDNLEFLQWLKKFWDMNFPGEPYDAEARRMGAAAAPPPLVGAVSVGAARNAPAASARAPVRAAAATRPSATAPVRRAAPATASARAAPQVPNETIHALTQQMDEMKVSVDSLEKERDFYFAKLRDIEILVQERLAILAEQYPPPEEGAEEEEPPTEEHESLRQIQAILYSTEEGFEVPDAAEVAQDEEEMF
ncbi:hypothetical protein Golomagni_06083 [Golovinomyces magnicellulatus]|nr:hypothetical protein Golomagni_06083 [Golovinomyces magnicellulatus]